MSEIDFDNDDDPYALDTEEPGPLTRLQDWFLLDGDRLFISLALSLAVFVLFLTLNHLGVIAFVNDDSITRLAGGMIAGTFSLVTLVVSINQLILSREFTAASEARDRLSGVMEFRGDIEEATGVPASPASPTVLLELLIESIHYRADALADSVDDQDGQDDDLREMVTEYADFVKRNADRVDETLEETSFGTFEAVSASVKYNDAWQIYLAKHIRNEYDDAFEEGTLEAFDELIDALQRFNVAREHFKTTYLQRELTRFSQLTIYCGVPSILSAMLVGFLYADLGGPAISVGYLPVVVSVLLAIIVSPLALLVAYILRTATVTRRTASVGPMLPKKDPETGPFEVSMDSEEE